MPRECGPGVNQVLCPKRFCLEASPSTSKLGPGYERQRETFFFSLQQEALATKLTLCEDKP